MEGRTIKDTAKAVGVNEKTVDTWLNLPLFQEQLQLQKTSTRSIPFKKAQWDAPEPLHAQANRYHIQQGG